MSRFTRIAAVCAASASLAAVSAAPAGAQQIELQSDSNVCYGTVTVPSCVNYTLDVADRAVQYAQETYAKEVQPHINSTACTVVYVITGDRCD